jgi:small subunit ribosomal protein S4
MKLCPKEKYCRRFGQKMLWNERCSSQKCGLVRRRQRPGMHGHKPRALSLYGRQLLEKQRLKFSYLLNEAKLKNYVKLAKKSKKSAPQALIELLERRLDNVIWRLGYVPSKLTARQLVSHGHFLVNGRRVKTPSYLVEEGDVIEIRPQSKDIKPFENLAQRLKFYQPPSWLEIDKENFKAKVLKLPSAEEISHNFNLPLVIDFYSRQ